MKTVHVNEAGGIEVRTDDTLRQFPVKTGNAETGNAKTGTSGHCSFTGKQENLNGAKVIAHSSVCMKAHSKEICSKSAICDFLFNTNRSRIT